MQPTLDELTLRIPFERELWEVQVSFELSPIGIPGLTVTAWRANIREHRSWWSMESTIRRASKLDGIKAVARRYLREFPRLLGTRSSTYELHLIDVRPEPPATEPERLTRELEDLLLSLAEFRGQLPSLGDSEILNPHQHLPRVKAWQRARRLLDDSLTGEQRARLETFYDGYERLPAEALRPAKDQAARRELLDQAIELVEIDGVRALQSILAEDSESSIVRDKNGNGQSPDWPLDRPVTISSIRVDNLRCFDTPAAIDLEAPDGRGQWIVFLGDNGAGKTTLLRSIALALLPPTLASSLVEQFMADTPLVRRPPGARGERKGSLKLDIEDRPFEVTIRGTDREESLVVGCANPLGPRPLVLGYGCRRGSALGGPERAADANPKFGVNTLFDENAALIHAETWLRKRALRAVVTPREDEPFFLAVQKTLEGLLPGVQHIHVLNDPITVEGPSVGEVPLAALSDGYLTTLGWTVDFIARFTEYARARPDFEPGDAFRSMPCVVLIDELDLHLHPRWQTRVIKGLREAFPMTTFIATTHNPLTLHNTGPGEVFVLRRMDAGDVEIVRRDVPPGLHADQIMTGEWFGLPSTLDPDTLELLQEHTRMLYEDVPRDDDRRREVEERLRRRLGGFADTSSERIAQQVVADYLEGETRPITDEDREQLRELFKQAMDARGSEERPAE